MASLTRDLGGARLSGLGAVLPLSDGTSTGWAVKNLDFFGPPFQRTVGPAVSVATGTPTAQPGAVTQSATGPEVSADAGTPSTFAQVSVGTTGPAATLAAGTPSGTIRTNAAPTRGRSLSAAVTSTGRASASPSTAAAAPSLDEARAWSDS